MALEIILSIFMIAFFLFPFMVWFVFNLKPHYQKGVGKWKTVFGTWLISWVIAIAFLLIVIFLV